MGASAAIYGVLGTRLTPSEYAFFKDAAPWGFILFARNVETPDQLRDLTDELRDAVGWDAPILIDQEGGRVQRLGPPHWQQWLPARDVVDSATDELAVAEALTTRYSAIAAELLDVGIDVNCVPVLDVPQPNAHPIIGDRALGSDPAQIALRGREAAAALLAQGVLPVIKHLPGHGRAMQDSHEHLPRVEASLDDLRRTDFVPFMSLRDMPLGMTAHVVYEALDVEACATLSPAVISLIREVLGFDGLLMTDDLSMKALDGPMGERATRALNAGCDLVLHCNGIMDEMTAVAAAVPDLSGVAAARADRALALRHSKSSATATLKVLHG